MKTFFSKICVIFFVVVLATSFSIGQNLVVNPGFEDGVGTLPDNWSTVVDTTLGVEPVFSWVTDEFNSGAKSVCITHADSAATSFYQTISVQPNYKYKVSGYIKTADVESGANWWEGGAQLLIEGDRTDEWWNNMTDRLSGTSDWTYVEKEFVTTETASTIEVHCKLGLGLSIKGIAWYDDISIDEVGPLQLYFCNGDFETASPDNPTFPDCWRIVDNENLNMTFGLCDDVYHGGSKSFKFHCPANKESGWIHLEQNKGPYPYGVVDGMVVKISGWIKTEGEGVHHARIRTGYDNGTIGEPLAGTNDWTYMEGEKILVKDWIETWGFFGVTAGKDSTDNSGSAWFDDINVEFISIPPGDPGELTSDYDGSSQITLNWDASEPGNLDIDYYLIRRIIQNDTTGNIKPNPGFEEPNENFDFAENWGHWPDGPIYTWVSNEDEPDGPHSGDYCVSMESSTGSWGMTYNRVYQPEGSKGCDAVVRGFVKTENVVGGIGASIAAGYGGLPDSGLYGTNDYTIIERYGCFDSFEYCACLFGQSGDIVTGKAWYDDVTVTPFDSIGKAANNTFVDADIVVSDTTYYYAVRAVDAAGFYSGSKFIKIDLRSVVGVENENVLLPMTTELIGNYPNPFNPSTTIAFQLHKPAKVKIEVYNICGQKVATVVNKYYNDIGKYKVNWTAATDAGMRLASGIYFYKLQTDDFAQVKKLLLLQ